MLVLPEHFCIQALAANLFPNAIAAVGLVPLGKLDLSAQSIKNLGLTVADFVDRGFATAAQLIKDFKSIDAKLVCKLHVFPIVVLKNRDTHTTVTIASHFLCHRCR